MREERWEVEMRVKLEMRVKSRLGVGRRGEVLFPPPQLSSTSLGASVVLV